MSPVEKQRGRAEDSGMSLIAARRGRCEAVALADFLAKRPVLCCCIYLICRACKRIFAPMARGVNARKHLCRECANDPLKRLARLLG